MCSIDAHKNNNTSEHDYGSSGGGYSIPSNSTTEALSTFHIPYYPTNFPTIWNNSQ